MRIYVSGKISGLPYEDVKTRFDDCQELLESIGFEVINPITMGLRQEATWEQHMVKDIELLLSCDAIYMMDNWTESTGAGIEYDIAFRLGKDIWFESSFARDNRNVMRIQNAIHEVMGLKFSDIRASLPGVNNETDQNCPIRPPRPFINVAHIEEVRR